MRIALDRQGDHPIYLQIRDRLQQLIVSGSLARGDRLPSIRSLARSLNVNKLTVIEAYSLLQADGLVSSRQGSGYFVDPITPPAPRLTSSFAPQQDVILHQTRSRAFFHFYDQAIQAHKYGGITDFSCSFPLEPPPDLPRIARRVINGSSDWFNYDFVQGQDLFRQQIAQILVQRGLEARPDQLMMVNGSMQGLALTFKYFLKPGDWIVVESPTFSGALAALENLGARIIGIPMTSNGINLPLLEQYLHSHQPKLIYTISTLHNPTGITTSLDHRRQLMELAQRYQCPILEDNAYEGLEFEPAPPPLKALDQDGWVIYVGTFSKTLAPGLRVGYMVVPDQYYPDLIEQKMLMDFHTPTLSQGIVSEYLGAGSYRRHLNRLNSRHQQNRNVMLQALEEHFPAEATWTVPQGGMFLWVQLPIQTPLTQISQVASTSKVLFAAGQAYFPGQQGYPAMRLAFANSSPAELQSGIEILGTLLKSTLTQKTS